MSMNLLSANNHFLGMVGNFILRSLYKQGNNVGTLQVLIRVVPEFRQVFDIYIVILKNPVIKCFIWSDAYQSGTNVQI